MKTFYCDNCGALVFFENVRCLKCDHALGFLPDGLDLSALESDADDSFRALSASAKKQRYRVCQNGQAHQVCNWLVGDDDENPFCSACRLNQTIPDLNVEGNLARWFRMEQAKRRLLYTVMQLGLPIEGDATQNRPPLRFNFLADSTAGTQVLTGHSNGLITLNIAEADDDERERRRVSFREPYRTLLGHFRHESGHYYWDRLVANSSSLVRFRGMFGDERQDYSAALQSYYQQGPAADWSARMVSAYASAHPWEDWAETWAHYLHIADTIETAAGFGIKLAPKHPAAATMKANPEMAIASPAFERILQNWLPLTHALNSLNRGMGLPDLYPFVLSQPAIEKLRFVHDVVHGAGAGNGARE
ncbi:MAG: putative zinc-binding peptidase [Akkermansiaceae bacterium]|nr:putative zinc-binding peptidase [Verrucomicrobiales bacterium]